MRNVPHRCICSGSGVFHLLAGTLLILFTLLSCNPVAYAGQYIGPFYSGGTMTTTGVPPMNYNLTGEGYGGGGGGLYGSASGTIVAIFIWEPTPGITDPPPASVVIKEWCRAVAYTVAPNPFPPNTPQANNGITAPPAPTTQLIFSPYYGTQKTIDYQSSRYSVQQGAEIIGVNCSPSASVNQIPGGSACSVRYTASITPVTVSLNGATPDTNNQLHILIGQRCTGQLNAGAVVQLSNYQWTIGGDTFREYQPSTGQTSVEYLNSTHRQQANPFWYWKQAEPDISVTCTATASVNGQSIGTVTGQRKINVVAPENDMVMVAGQVVLGRRPKKTGGYYPDTWIYAKGVEPFFNGATWGAWVNTPASPVNFAAAGTGYFCFVQTITNGRLRTSATVTNQPCLGYGIPGLDTSWPYEPALPGHPANVPLDGSPKYEGDSPGNVVEAPYSNYTIDEHFNCYLMYMPPGSDSRWVPLMRIKWYWACSADRPTTGWPPPGEPVTIPGSTVAVEERVPEHQHPTWSGLTPSGWP